MRLDFAHSFLQQFLSLQHLDGLEAGGAVFLHHLGNGMLHRGRVLQLLRGGGGWREHELDELVQPGLFQRAYGHHRAAQLAAQGCGIYLHAAFGQQVTHVERHHHGQPGFHELRAEVKVALQVSGIHHIHD